VFWHFGYGSNMALQSLHVKGVTPQRSERGVLRSWRLRFNVQHFLAKPVHVAYVPNVL
jgi:sulfite reductase (NADPH) flavoprotein alpha-component